MLGASEYLLVYHTSGLTLSVAGVLKVGEGEGREEEEVRREE